MIIKHEIIGFDPASGSILVKYFSDELADGLIYNIDVPVVDGRYIVGESLNTLINAFAPTGQMHRVDELKKGIVNSDEIQALVTALPIDTVMVEPAV
jgi:hypothetical protein